jgi:hypothetical protein
MKWKALVIHFFVPFNIQQGNFMAAILKDGATMTSRQEVSS